MTPEQAGMAVGALVALAALLASAGRSNARQRLRRHRPARRTAGHGGAAGAVAAGAEGTDGAGLGDTAMMLELIGAMLDAGSGLGRALELIAPMADKEFGVPLRSVVSALSIGADWDAAWQSSGTGSLRLAALKDALGFAALTGAPSSAILYAHAARIRREQSRAAEQKAAALGVKLVVPLGLCSLPAFVCLGVVPVLLAILPR